MEMVGQAEYEQLAKKICYDEAVQNTDSGMFLRFLRFYLPSGARVTNITKARARSSATTRSVAASKMESTLETEQWEDLPQVPVRSIGKHIDERIIRCAVQCLADYKVSYKDVTGIIMKTTIITK